MVRTRSRWGTIGLLLALVLVGATARAGKEDPAITQARALYEVGTKNYRVGNYREALEAFKKAYLVKRDPAFLFNLGQCYRQLGDLENEVREYRAYLMELPAAPNRGDVEQFISEAEKEIDRRREANLAKPAPPITPAPVAATEPAPPPTTEKPRSKWWIPVVAVGAAVVVGAAVTGAILATRPGDAPTRPDTDTGVIRF